MCSSPRTFPLFNLPDKVVKHVARRMTYVEIICLSIISDRTKKLVKSLNMTSKSVGLHVWTIVSISVPVIYPHFIHWNYDDVESLSIHIQLTNDLRDRKTRKLTKEGFHLGDWIRHLLFIFNHAELSQVMLSTDPDTIIPKPIFDSITGIDIRHLMVCDRNPNKDYRSLLPYVKQLSVHQCRSENRESIQEVIIQNFDYLEVKANVRLSLDDYLLMNSSFIKMNSRMTQKTVNRFIRHWIHGSNPRMKYMEYISDRWRRPNLQTILKGINYQVVPDDQVRVFEIQRYTPNGEADLIVGSGYNIYRRDGTQATIHARKFRPIGFRLFLLVWN